MHSVLTVGEVIDLLQYGTKYKLIGASTGKVLAQYGRNKEEYISKYYKHYAGSIFATINFFGEDSQLAYPMICIYVSGE